MSLYDIKEKLSENGYYCSCLKICNIFDIELECISLIKSSKDSLHVIVIIRVEGKYIYYYDPLYVFVKKELVDNFLLKWSHICLLYPNIMG